MLQIALRLEFGALGCFFCTGKKCLISLKTDGRFGEGLGGRSKFGRENHFVIS